MKAAVTILDRNHLQETSALLALAFREDPLMHYLFSDSPLDFQACLEELFRFSCEVRLLLDWPLLGCWSTEQELAGAAGFDLPEEKAWPPALEKVYREMGERVGKKATERLERYSELADANRPAAPHIKVGMIGIAPQYQGKGYGWALMHAVHSFAGGHPGVEGIWLDTENPRNLPWYNLLGYVVQAKTQLEEITIWGMYKELDRI